MREGDATERVEGREKSESKRSKKGRKREERMITHLTEAFRLL